MIHRIRELASDRYHELDWVSIKRPAVKVYNHVYSAHMGLQRCKSMYVPVPLQLCIVAVEHKYQWVPLTSPACIGPLFSWNASAWPFNLAMGSSEPKENVFLTPEQVNI